MSNDNRGTLILSRRVDESIIIDGDVEVTVLSVKGKQIRLGVKAPKDVAVDRKEIHELKLKEDAA